MTYCGIVEEVGSAVKSIQPGQFVVGSFATSDNTCPHCLYGYQSSCMHREFMLRAQAPFLRVLTLKVRSWRRPEACLRPISFRACW
jgi:threonine dehydrogenase-like Zn-dependent dehydrogenase